MAKSMTLVVVALAVTVSSQTYPHFEFRGSVLVNNSFMLRGEIREIKNISLNCVTDNSECCNNGQGDWFDERGNEVNVTYGTDGGVHLYVTRGDGVVYLNRRTGGASGMWRCDIPDSNGDLQSIFIYLGSHRSGRLTSSVSFFNLDSEANKEPPEFTLTCQSEGGPATEVVWTRNGVTVEEDSNHTTSQIIVDTSSNTVYNNTLRVKGREPGTYQCTVNNNRHTLNRTQTEIDIIDAQKPIDVIATYTAPTAILLEWTFSRPPSYDYRYVVYYQSEEGSRSVSFTGVRGNNTYLLTGLPSGCITSISLVTLVDLPSPSATPDFSPVPVYPVIPENIAFRDVKADSVHVQWTVSYLCYSPDTYVVQYGTSRDSLIYNSSLTYSKDGVTTYSVELSGLRANTTYYVQVLSTNTAQRSSRSSIESFTVLVSSVSSESFATRSTNCTSATVVMSAAVVGGVLLLIIIFITGVFAMATIILTIQNNRLRSKLAKREIDVSDDVDIKSVPTDSNAAYGVVSQATVSTGDVAMYEIVGRPPPPPPPPSTPSLNTSIGAEIPSKYIQPSQTSTNADASTCEVIAGK